MSSRFHRFARRSTTKTGPRPSSSLMVKFVAATLGCAALAGCGSDEGAIREILASDREAHFKLNATALASNIADTLISIDRGAIYKQSREDVETFLRQHRPRHRRVHPRAGRSRRFVGRANAARLSLC